MISHHIAPQFVVAGCAAKARPPFGMDGGKCGAGVLRETFHRGTRALL